MKNISLSCALLAALVAATWAATDSVKTTDKSSKTAATELVIDVLRREAREPIPDRAELLKPALEQAPKHETARWQSGFVFDARKKEWLHYNEVPAAAKSDGRLETYRSNRSKCLETADAQLELARWCLKRNLTEQARAHLTKVLELKEDHAEARHLLGQRLVAGNWLTEGEIAEAQAQAKNDMAAFQKWRPKLEKIRTNLGRGKRQSDAAREELMAIRDPQAAWAIEYVLCADGSEMAHVGIEALKNLPGREPAAALIRLALFLPWEPLGQSAARALRPHEKFDYVPLLLSLMKTPVQSRAQIYQSFNSGTLLYRHIFYLEGQNQREMTVMDTPYQHVFIGPPDTIRKPAAKQGRAGRDTFSEQINNMIKRKDAMERFQAEAMQKAAQVDAAVAQYNMTAEALNARLCGILSEAIPETSPEKESSSDNDKPSVAASQPNIPAEWYYWWNDYNELYTPEAPPRVVYISNPATIRGSRPTQVEYYSPAATRLSCLVGDTNVWTELGPVAIKDVAVGDRVFACDVETGCLALKPVLKKTIRPQKNTGDLVSITVDGKTILASGGHVFWVAGEGWVKARDLKAGMRLHTLQGTAEIEALATSPAQETYNLIVADFHTFFAGDVKSLTHDNTLREPTNVVVPGLTLQEANLPKTEQ
jgi:hypothetical protein